MKLRTIKSALISALAASTSFVAESTPDDNDFLRIVGGKNATENKYPYFVQMVYGCGGTLIAPDVVLFAAHCGDWTKPVDGVIVGAYRLNTVTQDAKYRICTKWIPDPMYSLTNSVAAHDFALCKLNEPVDIDNSNIRLEMNDESSVPSDGDALHTMGFGTIKINGPISFNLLDVEVPYVTNEKCNAASSYDGKIKDVMLCAGESGMDSCQGDSGGPLVKRTISNDGDTIVDTLVGVVSWGVGCGDPNFPGVYSRVSERLDWIKETTCTDLQSVAPYCPNNSTPPPTKAPTKAPTISLSSSDCVDNSEFRSNKDNKNSCVSFLKGNRRKKKRLCKKPWENNTFVYHWCPATCAKARIGNCRKKKKRKKKNRGKRRN